MPIQESEEATSSLESARHRGQDNSSDVLTIFRLKQAIVARTLLLTAANMDNGMRRNGQPLRHRGFPQGIGNDRQEQLFAAQPFPIPGHSGE